jgi:hypothetical protein
MAKKSRSPALRRKSQSPAPRAAADPTFRLRGDATAAVDVDPIVVAAVAAACTLACSESGSSLLWDENGTIRSNVLGTNSTLKYWPRELQPLFEEDLALPCLNVSMFFYCVYIADKVKGALGPSARPLHSVVTSLLTAFGGGTIVPLLLGVPVVWLRAGDLFLYHLLPAWCLVNLEAASTLRGLLLDHAAGRALTGSLFGAFRACVVFALIGMARGASVPGGVGFFSLLVCGTLGGCGGILLPFSKGLDPIKDGAPCASPPPPCAPPDTVLVVYCWGR